MSRSTATESTNRLDCAQRLLKVLDDAAGMAVSPERLRGLTELNWRLAGLCAGHHSGNPSPATRAVVIALAASRWNEMARAS